MDLDAVLEKFSLLSGISGESLQKWSYICEDSISEIRAKLRENIKEEDYDYILCAATAALSFYKYTLCVLVRNDINSESEYAVNNNITKSIAQTLWNDYKSTISHLIVDDKFVFKRII